MLVQLGLALLVLPLLILMGFWGVEYSQVSACIVEGGSFDYLLGECLFDQIGFFVPFAERHPLLVKSCLWLSCLGLLLSIIGLYRGKMDQ